MLWIVWSEWANSVAVCKTSSFCEFFVLICWEYMRFVWNVILSLLIVIHKFVVVTTILGLVDAFCLCRHIVVWLEYVVTGQCNYSKCMVKVIFWHKAALPRKQMLRSYSLDGTNVPSYEGTLSPPGEYDWTCASFGPPESTTQMASRSVQLFLHSSRQGVTTFYYGLSLFPL